MIDLREDETRASYLMRVAAKYIADCPENSIDYDETTCDGYCLSEELLIEAENLSIDDSEPPTTNITR